MPLTAANLWHCSALFYQAFSDLGTQQGMLYDADNMRTMYTTTPSTVRQAAHIHQDRR